MHKIGYMTPPRGSQDASRTDQDGFCLRFGRQLGAKLEPCWPLFPPKTFLWRLQVLLKTPLRTSQEPLPPGPMGYPCFGRQEPMGYPCFWLIFSLIFGWFLIYPMRSKIHTQSASNAYLEGIVDCNTCWIYLCKLFWSTSRKQICALKIQIIKHWELIPGTWELSRVSDKSLY